MNEPCAAIADLVNRGFHAPVFQPIRQLATGRILGFEALMRGPEGTELAAPAAVFRSAAADLNLLHRLDLDCVLSAVRVGRLFSDPLLLFVNMRGETLVRLAHSRDELTSIVERVRLDTRRIVLEISELTDNTYLREVGNAVAALRESGMRIALDDVGVRFAWLQHMLWLEPDILKLDRDFVHGIDGSSRKRDLVAAFVRFCADTGAQIIAEGIETAGERSALIDAGVQFGQGYFLGRPQAIQQWTPPGEETEERARISGLLTNGETIA